MSWEPGELVGALRGKAAGRRNHAGDKWDDWICDDAADRIEKLEAALSEAILQVEYLDPHRRGTTEAVTTRARVALMEASE